MGGIFCGLFQSSCLPKPAILLDDKLKFICFLKTPITAMQVKSDYPNHAITEVKNFRVNSSPVPIADMVDIRDGAVYVLYRIKPAVKPREEEREERKRESTTKSLQDDAEVQRLRSIQQEKRRPSGFVAGMLEVIPEEEELCFDDRKDIVSDRLRVLWD